MEKSNKHNTKYDSALWYELIVSNHGETTKEFMRSLLKWKALKQNQIELSFDNE